MTRSEIVGENIRKYRNARNLTQTEFGSAVGRSQSIVAQYESGQRQPSTEIIMAIANFFGVPFDMIYYSDEERNPDIPDKDWYDEAFDPNNGYPQGKYDESRHSSAPKTVEARAVSGWMDDLPEEQRQWIQNVVQSIIATWPELQNKKG